MFADCYASQAGSCAPIRYLTIVQIRNRQQQQQQQIPSHRHGTDTFFANAVTNFVLSLRLELRFVSGDGGGEGGKV